MGCRTKDQIISEFGGNVIESSIPVAGRSDLDLLETSLDRSILKDEISRAIYRGMKTLSSLIKESVQFEIP